jgi:hypothetical protein
MVQTSWDSEWILKRIEGNGEERKWDFELNCFSALPRLFLGPVQSTKPPWQATPEQRVPKSGATIVCVHHHQPFEAEELHIHAPRN